MKFPLSIYIVTFLLLFIVAKSYIFDIVNSFQVSRSLKDLKKLQQQSTNEPKYEWILANPNLPVDWIQFYRSY